MNFKILKKTYFKFKYIKKISLNAGYPVQVTYNQHLKFNL